MLLSYIREEIYNLISVNRQVGQTTALVKAAIETNGILVVHNQGSANILRKQHPELRVVSMHNMLELRGNKPQVIFFDNPVLLELCRPNQKIKDQIIQLLTDL